MVVELQAVVLHGHDVVAAAVNDRRDGHRGLADPAVLGRDGGHPAVVERGPDLSSVLDGHLVVRVGLEVALDSVVGEHAVCLRWDVLDGYESAVVCAVLEVHQALHH